MPKTKTLLRLENKPLFAVGLLFLTSFLVYRIHLLVRLSFRKAPPVIETKQDLPTPTQIKVPAVKIDLPVYPTAVQNNLWQIDPRGISYLAASARPGQAGPIILYGHNTNDRFGPLRWLETGDQIFLKDDVGNDHAYKVETIMTVTPTNIESLAADKEMLVIYTCTGFLDRERLVIRALPD